MRHVAARLGMGVVAWAAVCTPGYAEPADCRLENGPQRTVVRLVDDTDLELDDGRVVRLAGILLAHAETVVSDTARGTAAAVAALTTLTVGQVVHLRFPATRRDRHGLVVAHVFPAGAGANAASVQARLLAAGLARAAPVAGERACATEAVAIEAAARAAGQGLWGERVFRVLPARPAQDLAGYAGVFQIVQGQVVATETARGNRVRLRLGPDRRRDLTVTLPAGDRDLLGPLGGDAAALRGRHVEVRGWLQTRPGGGPDIDLTLAGHIRLVTP